MPKFDVLDMADEGHWGDVIIRTWSSSKCPGDTNGKHWAYYVVPKDRLEYWRKERTDVRLMLYWRHYEFISIPCHVCGAMSPLRATTYRSTNINGYYDGLTCTDDQIVDYNPGDVIDDRFDHVNIDGWGYTYFKDALSDSLDPQQATFKLVPKEGSNDA